MKLPWYLRAKSLPVLIAGLGGLLTVIELAPAQTWEPTSAPRAPWRAVACSADGTKLVATGCLFPDYGTVQLLPIYVSTNSGMTWRQTSAPVTNWTCLASSA